MRTSPYRHHRPDEATAPRLPAPLVRRRSKSLLARCLGGSILAHAALAGACWAMHAPRDGTVDGGRSAPWAEEEGYLVVLHPALDLAWSPPPAVAACFERRVVEAMRRREEFQWGMMCAGMPCRAKHWSDVYSIGLQIPKMDPNLDGVREAFYACDEAASLAGVGPSVRHEVRVRTDAGGEASVSLTTAYGPDLDERLRCCLTSAGESLAPWLGPRDELRYEGGPHGRGVSWIRDGSSTRGSGVDLDDETAPPRGWRAFLRE